MERFFPERSAETAYGALRSLFKVGVIQQYCAKHGGQTAVTSTRKGFDLIIGRLPHLKENGFKIEAPCHDLFCTAIQLGDWMANEPLGGETFTEQQLRRYSTTVIPDWVPDCTDHRPDGFWKIPSRQGNSIHALEVELSTKTKREYLAISRFYKRHRTIDRIHWLVSSKSIGHRISEQLCHSESTGNTHHNFMEVNDYVKNEWNTSIFLGPDWPRTFKESLSTFSQLHVNNWGHKVALDLSKKPFNSTNYKFFDHVAFCR